MTGKMISSRLLQVAPHPVGAGEIDLFVAAVAEVEDAGVFQEAVDDRADLDVLGDALARRAAGSRCRGR